MAADLHVLLTPRQPGGHEKALFAWLRDAVEHEGLVPALWGAEGALADAVEDAGLQRFQRRGGPPPADAPLLLAPGVPHAQAWRLPPLLLRGHEVWLYIPMTYTAARMGYRHARWRDALLAPWLRRVRGWITIDERQANGLRDAWHVAAPVHVLPNQLPAGAPPAELEAGDGRLRIGVVGRLDPWQKGLDWLVHELATDPALSTGRHWRFQGEGPARPALEALAQRLGPQRMQLHPHAPLNDALAACDLLLLPSRYEGVPLVALEASARGWPLLASREAGLQQLLPPSSQFAFGDKPGLQRALATLAQAETRAAAVAHAQARLTGLTQPRRYGDTLQALVRGWRERRAAAAAPAVQAR